MPPPPRIKSRQAAPRCRPTSTIVTPSAWTTILKRHPAAAYQVAAGGTALPPDFHHRNAFGMYSYLEARLSRVVYPGFLFEYVEDLDKLKRASKGYSPYLTLWASE